MVIITTLIMEITPEVATVATDVEDQTTIRIFKIEFRQKFRKYSAVFLITEFYKLPRNCRQTNPNICMTKSSIL